MLVATRMRLLSCAVVLLVAVLNLQKQALLWLLQGQAACNDMHSYLIMVAGWDSVTVVFSLSSSHIV
jgi:hypothetical protein